MGSWRGGWDRMIDRVKVIGSYRKWSEASYGTHNHHRATSEKERELTLFGIKTTAHVGPHLTQDSSQYWLPSFFHLWHHCFNQHGCSRHINAQNLKPTERKTT